jgi:hypothetical protein
MFVTGLPHPCIYRITVDERLDEDRVRLLITSLAHKAYRDGERFRDSYDTWVPDEREESISQSELACLRTELGISSTQLDWKALEEGRVYLAGEFSLVADGFAIARGDAAFERIDQLEFVKAPAREFYTNLLVRRAAGEP